MPSANRHPTIARPGLAALLAFGCCIAANIASAEETYPSRPIKLIVPFPAGGPADVMGRLIAQRLSVTLGQVIIENRPGAGGTLAGKAVATADPDGYTLLLGGSGPLAIGPALYRNIGYDPLKDLVPVAMVSSVPYVMIGATNAPYKTIRELIAYAKSHPGQLTFGVPNGAPPHMLAEMFKTQAGLDILVVPYRGASTLITDMIGGRIHGGFETTSVMFAHLHDGNIRGLAVLRETRLTEIPDMPTMIESGIEMVGSSWINVIAPQRTAPEIIDRLRAEITIGLRSPELSEKFSKLGAEARFMTPPEHADFIASEYKRALAVMHPINAKPE